MISEFTFVQGIIVGILIMVVSCLALDFKITRKPK